MVSLLSRINTSMAKCNIHFHFLLHLTLFLQIMISQITCLEAATPGYNSSVPRPRCIEAERKALLQFKKNLINPYGRLSSWVGEDCCGWVGVGCNNRTGNVVKLDLGVDPFDDSSILKGKLSPSLLELSQLTYLNLSWNAIEGMIPPQLGNLSNLHYLDLSYNLLWVSDLNWLSGLTSLEYLNLRYVNLSKASTSWFEAISLLPNLSELHLINCKLRYPYPLSSSIANHTSLSIIDLSGNQLISEVPSFLFNITTLVHLVLSGCNITDPVSHLPWHSLHNLEVLDLGFNSISHYIGPLIDVLPPFLSELYLEDCDIQYPHPLSLSIANHTSLSIIDLSFNKLISEIPPLLFNITTLVHLDLSSCNITGPISHLPWHNLHKLEVLDLGYNPINDDIGLFIGKFSSNKMSGSIPISVGDLSSLIHLDLSHNNYWKGKLSEVHFRKLSKLKYLSISSANKALVFDMARDWIPPFSLQTISINDCLLGPTFPPWIQTQKELLEITLSNVNISDTIPDWFWNLLTPQVTHLDLSGNEIRGKLPYSLQFNSIVDVDLSDNHLNGSIPLWSNVVRLVLRNNSFSGPIPTEIGKITSSLRLLDLSLNFINGTIPKSIGTLSHYFLFDLSDNNLNGELPLNFLNGTIIDNMDVSGYLDLSKNNLSGEIPMSICSSHNFNWIDLSHNSFNGGLPSSMQNCTALEGLNLGGNRLSGNIPRWSGKSLQNIRVLSLTMNKLVGEIPQELCHLPNLHALDLSHNNLSGMIPACFGNLSRLTDSVNQRFFFSSDDVMGFVVKGQQREYDKILDLINILDLSSNNLTGEIPKEIANLLAIGTLNFSRNQLNGKIPEKIGELRQLETLDLSHNHLSGSIPASMASLTSLNYLDLSFNNFSGSIPSSTQLSTFNNSIYEGNPGLCGPPLSNPCYSPVIEDPDKGKNEKGKVGNKDQDEMFWFYVSMGSGFVVGLWGLFGSLVIKRTWRIACFEYIDGVNDRLFVLVSLKITLLKKMMKRGEN